MNDVDNANAILVPIDNLARRLRKMHDMTLPLEAMTQLYLAEDDLHRIMRIVGGAIKNDPYVEAGENEYERMRDRHIR